MKENKLAAREPEEHGPPRGWIALMAACFAALVANASVGAPPNVPSLGNGAAGVLSRATDLGAMSSTSSVELTVWLKLRDGAGLDRTLDAQRASGGGWLSKDQIDQRHAPAAEDVAAVSAFLKAQGLTVTRVGPHNLFVKARGTAATVNAAFEVQLHQYTFRGTPFHASRVKPTLPASIAPLVVSVGGLSDLPATPMIVFPHLSAGAAASDTEVSRGKPAPLSAAGPQGIVYSPQCLYPQTTVSFSSSTASATYSGAVYGASITNAAPGTLFPCGYQASDMQTAYNLTPLYQAGLDGTGETIAIVDAYGSITVQQDLATFSARMGLPPAKLQILGTSTGSNFSSSPVLRSWAGETDGDVEEVHAIAPGANILLVIAPSNSLDDLAAGVLTAAQQPGVVSISNSWGYFESFTDVPSRTAADAILRLAAARGISVNFASGDYGNGDLALGYADVDYPASSPYATAVGGVTVALGPSKHILFQTPWGTSLWWIASSVASGSAPVDPPGPFGNLWGGGGGVSDAYPLPPFQASLSRWGTRRLVPDISWVADPFTGVEVVLTTDSQGDQGIGVAGGTSVATSMFSALWSIAVQKAKGPLGQAANLLYTLPPEAITDVVAPIPFANVMGTLTDASGTQELAANDLAAPLQGHATFLSTLYNAPGNTSWFVLTFGIDSRLRAGPGWDPATGLGTPNGAAFVDALSPE